VKAKLVNLDTGIVGYVNVPGNTQTIVVYDHRDGHLTRDVYLFHPKSNSYQCMPRVACVWVGLDEIRKER
jgi:hypothetical protein